VELFVSSVAACAAQHAGHFLDWHCVSRDGLRVQGSFRMADDRPARVSELSLTVQAPALPEERLAALRAVISHCTVSSTLARPPEIHVRVVREAPRGSTAPSRPGSVR
jgi:uncharacterized OsmC-like protein